MTTQLRRIALGFLLATALMPLGSRPAVAANDAPAPPSTQPGSSAADVDEAKARFKAGKELYEKGDFAKALTEFEAGYLLTRNSAFLINVALCHQKMGHKDEALEHYRSFLAAEPTSPRRAEVEAHIAELGGANQKPSMSTKLTAAPPTDDPAYAPPPSAASAPVPTRPQAPPPPAPPHRTGPAVASAARVDDGTDQDGEALIETSSGRSGRRAAPVVSRRASSVDDDDEEDSGAKPFYKKGWFWGVAGAVVAGVVVGAIIASKGSSAPSGSIGTIDARNL